MSGAANTTSMPLPTGKTSLMSQVVHLLVLALMLVALLVLLTKFNWVHCSQVPGNWCDIYCNTIMRSHSRIALLYRGRRGQRRRTALDNHEHAPQHVSGTLPNKVFDRWNA